MRTRRISARGALGAALGTLLGGCGGGGGIAPVTPPPPPVTFALSVAGSDVGSGRVTSADGKIDCRLGAGGGGTCSASFNSGTSVSLTATPSGTDQFAGWTSGPCTGTTNPCTVVVSTNVALAAGFRPAVKQVTLSLQTPNADDGAMLLTLTGPSLLAIRPSAGLEIKEVRDTVAGVPRSRMLLRGALASGVVAQLDIAGSATPAQYTAQIQQVAARASGRYAQRTSLAGYALTVQ